MRLGGNYRESVFMFLTFLLLLQYEDFDGVWWGRGGGGAWLFLGMGRWAKWFLSFSRLLHFSCSCGQYRMIVMIFLEGDGGGREGGGVGPRLWLLTFLQVFVGVVEEFEEVRGFSCSESGRSGVVLVWVILACELSVMHLDLHFGCAKSKPKNF